jgi:hypothetical protein
MDKHKERGERSGVVSGQSQMFVPHGSKKKLIKKTGEATLLLQEFAQGAGKNPSDFCRLSVPRKPVKAVFRSKLWCTKIHCSISFVFGNNCPIID